MTLLSLSLTRDRFHSLTLPSLSFREVSFEDGSEKELEESLAHTFLERRAGTNSFSKISLQEKKPPKEAKTNSFSSQSFSGILSLNLWWRIFFLCSFPLVCAALLLGACSFRISFPTESLQADQLEATYFRSSFDRHSLQQEELVAAYGRKSFEQQSFQQDELELACLLRPMRASQLDSLEQMELCRINFQLDLETSLSLPWFSLLRCRYQLQSDSFDGSSFEQRALSCAALLYKTRISTQLQGRQVQSFQLQWQQLSFGLVSGGVHLRAFYQPALQTRPLSTALTLISLSLAITAWLKPSSKRA